MANRNLTLLVMELEQIFHDVVLAGVGQDVLSDRQLERVYEDTLLVAATLLGEFPRLLRGEVASPEDITSCVEETLLKCLKHDRVDIKWQKRLARGKAFLISRALVARIPEISETTEEVET